MMSKKSESRSESEFESESGQAVPRSLSFSFSSAQTARRSCSACPAATVPSLPFSKPHRASAANRMRMASEDELAGEAVPIRPPRLEDAGLEDCALPPDSIAEAFSLAALAVSSRLTLSEDSDDEEDEEARISALRGGGCVDDAAPTRGAVPDALVGGGGTGGGSVDEVLVVGGGRGGGCEDAVVVGRRAEDEDRVVVVGEERAEKKLGKEDGCVEGVRDGVSEPRRVQGDGDEVEKEAEKVILVPDFD